MAGVHVKPANLQLAAQAVEAVASDKKHNLL